MKILYNIGSTAGAGGTDRVITSKANWLAGNGYDVVIVTTSQGGRPSFFELDPRVRCIDLGIDYQRWKRNPLRRHLLRPFKRIVHRKRLKEVLMRERPDITIMTGNDIGFDIKDGSKKISESHFARGFKLNQQTSNPIRSLINAYWTWQKMHYGRKYDAFVCLTEEDKEDWGPKMTNIRVIPNFIRHTDAPLASLQNKQAIAVGRLVNVKRFDRLIDAWALVHRSHPDWKLNIYGDGPLQKRLNEQIVERGLAQSVAICEPTKDIMKAYAESSLLISTSASEGLPMVMLEAIGCGLPVVTFGYKCGPRDLVEHGKSGFIVSEGDIKGLAEGIGRVIEDDRLRKSMGEAAYKKSLEFDQAVVMPKWVSLFDELCKR